MAFQCFVDTFNMTTGIVGSTIVRTGYGFTPKACLYWWTGRAEPGITTFSTATLQAGFGMAAGPTSRACVSSYSQNAIGTMVTNRRHDNVNVIATTTNISTVDQLDGSADLQSFDANGQTLVITDAFAASPRIHCLALGGSDLTNAALVQVSLPTSGTRTVTVGFQPSALIFMTASMTTSLPAIATDATISLGMASGTGAGVQGVAGFYDEDNQASSQTGRHSYGGSAVETWLGYSILAGSYVAQSVTTTGFVLSTAGSTDVMYAYVLVLGGGSAAVGNFLTSTTLNATIVESGLGFAPRGCLLISTSAPVDAVTTPSLQANLSLGAFTSPTNRAAQSLVSNNAANSAVCASSLNEDACLRMLNNGTTSAGVVDVSAVGSDGFTLIMDVADVTTAKYVTYLAFGDGVAAPAGGPLLPHMMQQHGG